MEVYKIVVPVIALIIVMLISVIAEMLGTAQEARQRSSTDRRKPQQSAAATSRVAQTAVDNRR